VFGAYPFGLVPFNSTPTYSYFATSGGAVASGSVTLTIPPECACNLFVFVSSGGAVASGSAIFPNFSLSPSGGAVASGSAEIEVLGDVFDGYSAFWLLNESGTGSADEYRDLTRSEFHGQGGGGNPTWTPTLDSGVFCRGSQALDGKQYIRFPQDHILPTQAFTVTLWAKVSTSYRYGTWFSRGFDSTPNTWVFQFGHSYLNQLTAQVNTVSPTTGLAEPQYALAASKLEKDRWYHIAAVWNPGDSLKLYANGVLHASKSIAATSLQPLGNGSYVGRFNTGQTPTGNIQEVRLFPGVRDPAWLLAEYRSVCSSDFLTIGEEEIL